MPDWDALPLEHTYRFGATPDLEHSDSPTWQYVQNFAAEMERKLSLRGHGEGWLIETPRWLFERMLTEVEELGRAIGLPVTIEVGEAQPDGEELDALRTAAIAVVNDPLLKEASESWRNLRDTLNSILARISPIVDTAN